MAIFALALIGAGFLISIVATLLILIKAFRTSILWGLAVLLLPGILLVYCIVYWARAKRLFFMLLASALMASTGTYMLVDNGIDSAASSSASVDPTAGPLTENETDSAQLPDVEPADGRCIGWQRSLLKGDREKIAQVAECLEGLAKLDRPAATQQATELQAWDIHPEYGAHLKVLASTLVTFPSDDALQRYLESQNLLIRSRSHESATPPSLTANSFLEQQGNIHWFDTETGIFPNYHNELLAELAALSKDFAGFTFEEIAPDEDAGDELPYMLIAKGNGKQYRQEAENYGDWYDVDAVLLLLNTIAEDIHSSDRFLVLPTEDQTAIVLVAPQAALAKLFAQNLLYVADPSAARLGGKAFEKEVTEKLQGRGMVE